jgi:GT2 family glycosyltransferase
VPDAPSPTISVIIPVHNGASTLLACLDALLASVEAPLEVFVVDDASTDDSAETARRHRLNPIVIASSEGNINPCGPAQARNVAASWALGDILVFVDSDVVVHKHTLGRFRAEFAKYADVAAVFGSYDSEPAAKTVVSQYKNLLHHLVHQKGGKRDAQTFWAGCGAVRRDAFEAMRGFDAGIRQASIEDIELGMRLRRAGMRIRLCPEIQGKHLKRWTLASLVRTDIFCRALPWSRLLMEQPKGLPNDLNVDTSNRLSAGVVLLGVLSLLAAFKWPLAALGLPVALLVMTLLNLDLFRSFIKYGGWSVALAAVPLHALYLLYSSASFVYVAADIRAARLREKYALTPKRCVLLFFLALMILSNSGRLVNGDALEELRASTLLVTTGHLGAKFWPSHHLWMTARDGLHYEYHDIGAVLVMAPWAWLAAHHAHGTSEQLVHDPPQLGRACISMTYSVISAFGAYFLYLLFALYWPRRTAFILSALFAVATIFWPYSKSCWDVILACVASCGALYYSGMLLQLRDDKDLCNRLVRTALALGISVGTAALARFYYSPVLMLGALGILLVRRAPVRAFFASGVPIVLAAAGELAYNRLRTGSVAKSAAIGNNSVGTTLHEPIWRGLYGLSISPNRGIIAFAPIFIFALAFPWIRKRLPSQRLVTLIAAYGVGALLYVCFIAKLSFWGTFGWGPRYMVPVIPILFLPVAASLVMLWEQRRWRAAVSAIIVASFLLNLGPVLVNWHLAVTEYRHNHGQDALARLPLEEMSVWNGLRLAAEGRPLPMPADVSGDPVRREGANFPDLWMARLWETGRPLARLADLVVTVGLLLIGMVCLMGALSQGDDQRDE